jgi:peptidyl-prolyl cis-trans isomerase D
MLQTIRDRSQSWLMSAIIVMACLAFAVWGIHSYLSGSVQPDVIATVNKQPIAQAQFNQLYERLRQQQQMRLGADFAFDQKIEAQLKTQALNQLLMGYLLTQAAKREGFRATMTEVARALLVIPAFQVNGQFSRARFNETLSGILYTEKDFLADLQTTMLTNQARSGFVESEFALSNEVETAVRLVNQKRDIGYLVIPSNRFINTVKISPAAALAYYQQQPAKFTTPEQVSIEYLELSLPQIVAQQHFTDSQLQKFYQNNLSNYTHPERWRVARLLVKIPVANNNQQATVAAKMKIENLAERIRAGEDFAQLAQTYSDDKAAAKTGGMMPWFSPGMIDPAIEKAVLTLAKPGDVSAPIKTQEGFSIIKLIDMQQPQVAPFAAVRPAVEKALAQQQAEHIFAEASDKLSNLTYANPTSIDIAAKALSLQVKTSGFFTKQGGKDTITSNPKVFAAAFSADVMNGNNSSVIEASPDTLLVLRIKQHQPARLQPFSQIQDKVTQQLKAQAAQQQAQALGKQILQQMQQGQDIVQVAKKTKLVWHAVPNITRFGTLAPATLINMAFRMPRPALPTKPSTAGIKLSNGDYAVLLLAAVHDGVIDDKTDFERRVYREQLENSFGQLDYALYVKGLKDRAKIVINKSNIKSS